MPHRVKTWFRMLALIGATAASCLLILPARADNTVTLTILPKSEFHASVVDATLSPIEYSDEPTQVTGALQLIVSDPRGTSEGWGVSIASTDFVYQGDSPAAQDIPNTGFRIDAVQAPTVIEGQPVGPAGPYPASLNGASLDSTRTVIWAEPGAGSGDYQQRIDVALDIPAGSEPGTYVATLTVAFVTGP